MKLHVLILSFVAGGLIILSFFQDSVISKQSHLIKAMSKNPACMIDQDMAEENGRRLKNHQQPVTVNPDIYLYSEGVKHYEVHHSVPLTDN